MVDESLYIGSDGGCISVLDVKTMELLESIENTLNVLSMLPVENGSILCGSKSGEIFKLNKANNVEVRHKICDSEIKEICIFERLIACACGKDGLMVIN